MSRTLRVVAYAVNGSGVGHLTRLHGIARWIRRYAAAVGVKPEISFLTSCEADSILFGDRFPSFKLPSKTVINEAGFDKLAYLGLAKQWVWHSLALLRPDLLIVDTFPRGAYGELLGALDLVRRKAFVYRPTKASFAARADFQAMLPLYDLVVVPDSRDQAEIQVPTSVQSRLRFVGPVVSRERCELSPRDVARQELGIEGDRVAVLVSAGGGGDPGVDAHLATVHRALADDESIHLVLAAGPLHRGKPIRGPRVTWIEGPALADRMLAFDVAICAAGYNTFHEVMLAGIPALFVPQEKIADEQDRRAERAIAVGAAATIELTVEGVREGLARFRDKSARESAANAARSLVPASHARDAAAEMLRLVLSPHEVDAAEEIVTDEVLASAPSLDALLSIMRTLCNGEATARFVGAALDVSRALDTAGVPATHQHRIVDLVARKLPTATPDERAVAIRALIDSFQPFSDWNGAAILLSVLQTERQLAPSALVDRLGRFLASLRARGGDLYQGVGDLSRASATAEPGTNDTILRTEEA